jgi:hypothetical protein
MSFKKILTIDSENTTIISSNIIRLHTEESPKMSDPKHKTIVDSAMASGSDLKPLLEQAGTSIGETFEVVAKKIDEALKAVYTKKFEQKAQAGVLLKAAFENHTVKGAKQENLEYLLDVLGDKVNTLNQEKNPQVKIDYARKQAAQAGITLEPTGGTPSQESQGPKIR